MKLFVDDIRNVPDESWSVTRTINGAIKAILQFNPEVVSLDHDISHQVSVGKLSRPYPCDECFCAVAYFLKEKYWMADKNERPKIIIHTSNPAGAKEMAQILTDFEVTFNLAGIANRLELEL